MEMEEEETGWSRGRGNHNRDTYYVRIKSIFNKNGVVAYFPISVGLHKWLLLSVLCRSLIIIFWLHRDSRIACVHVAAHIPEYANSGSQFSLPTLWHLGIKHTSSDTTDLAKHLCLMSRLPSLDNFIKRMQVEEGLRTCPDSDTGSGKEATLPFYCKLPWAAETERHWSQLMG